MSQKAALKNVRALLDSRDYEQAAVKAQELCQKDPRNYHGHVFLGLALDKLSRYDESERAYQTATKIKDNDRTAWQGLISLYETQGPKKLDSYGSAVTKLCQIFAEADEKTKAQAVVDRYIGFSKKEGSKLQYKHALELLLPSSPLYILLEETLPHPAQTYLQLIELSESDEKEFINREIGERRTRLGAKIDQVTLEVRREAFQRSDLESLYNGLISWTRDDELRRTYEEKMLVRAYEYLKVLPAAKKAPKRDEVLQAARDMVIIKHPFELAWKIMLEWKDTEDLSELDVTVLRDFIEMFPNDGLSKVLRGYLMSDISPFPKDAEVLQDEGTAKENSEEDNTVADMKNQGTEDVLLIMAEGLEQSPASILAHRIMAQTYLSLQEFEATVNVTRKALPMVMALRRETGLSFQNTLDAINISLATALISYQSPKNNPEAREIFEDVLKRKRESAPCLLGIGLILEEDQDYSAAIEFLEEALQRNPENAKIRSELFWCKARNGELVPALSGLEDTLSIIEAPKSQYSGLKAEVLYRIGYCIWELDPTPSARKDRTGAYSKFLGSIQADMNYAPAYTNLGIYYADYKKDQKRARRCFHKAFELSSVEIEAAERLARDFAAQGDWDLVEAVAQRVVDSGRAKPAPGSKRKGYSWPYAALGVVEINRQQYAKSIVSFQAALRISPDDYQCWVGLGESYHNAGRYIAATKAFQHAESLEPSLPPSDQSQIWFARYMMANVQRELGEYEDAIARYKGVLRIRPNEFGVTLALLQTLTEASWKAVESGLFGEAAERAAGAVKTGISLAKQGRDAINLWKAIADAFSTFSWIKGKASLAPIAEFISLIETRLDMTSVFQTLADIDGVNPKLASLFGEDVSVSNKAIYATILAYKLTLSVSSNDKHAQAVAWYNLGWAEYRAYMCWEDEGATSRNRKRLGFLKASMRCFKRAIELEAGNSEFWNALGVATTTLNPKVAQHSFVRSLHIDDKNAQVWTNLGALYLLHNDHQLANEAFTRAQSADPNLAHAWLGQGFIALIYGDVGEARELFTHAFTLSNSSIHLSKRLYSMSIFDHISTDLTASDVPRLIQPLFALHQLHSQDPSNLAFQHLSALVAERISDFEDAESSLKIVCSGVEAEFESSESISALCRYVQAKADLARVQLGRYDYEAAADSAETALSLSEDGVGGFDKERYQRLRLSAHLTAGLACYYLGNMDRAIDMFREALREANSDPDVVCLLAQVLWAKGGEEERDVAREQLFDCIEKHPDHVGAVTLLGVIALLDADENAIEAVESDLHNMRTRDDIDIHSRAKITQLLAGISSLGLGQVAAVPEERRRIHEACNSVMISPGLPEGWVALSEASEESYPAEMAVKTALQNIPPRGELDATDLCKAYAHTGWREDAVRAIMVAPWKVDGWTELGHCLSEA
ncbi:hypothetical protein VTO42DRAFT_3501 [Malbranchea cinnamomea]